MNNLETKVHGVPGGVSITRWPWSLVCATFLLCIVCWYVFICVLYVCCFARLRYLAVTRLTSIETRLHEAAPVGAR